MLRFKQFIQLQEELTQDQKDEVATWSKRSNLATKNTDSYFGKDVEDKYTPLKDTQDKSETHRAIERQLGSEIEPEDYKSGQTKDLHGRPVRIGKLLRKQKLMLLQKEFENDTTRQGKGYSGLTVRTTRSAEGVAGQTSGNQSWENESCKNIKNGSNKSYLPNEVKHGTVVHYLLDHQGKEIARATSQPYYNLKGRAVYRTDSHYGIQHQGFKDHVEQANKEMSQQKDPATTVYSIHPDVYNDSGVNKTLHPNASENDITDALSNNDENIRNAAITHPNATTKHINKALDDDIAKVRISAIIHPNATTKHIDKALNDQNWIVRHNAIKHSKVTPNHIDKALSDTSVAVRGNAIKHSKVTPENINKALKDENRDVRYNAIQHKNVNSNNIDSALNDEDYNIRAAAIQHKKASISQIESGLLDKHPIVRLLAKSRLNSNK